MLTNPDLRLKIPATYGLSLLKLMQERGHATSTLLEGSPLTLEQLQDTRGLIEAWHYALLLNRAMGLDADHGLAYELGLRSQVTKHGFVGFGLISCGTLREAIAFAERYFQARVPAFRSTLSVDGAQVIVALHETIPLGPRRDFIMDLVAVELCSLFAKVLDIEPARQGWMSEIWVPHAEPAAYARYRDRIPPFHFNQGVAGGAVQIRFPAPMLDEPISTADPVSVKLAIERLEQELARQAQDHSTTTQVLGLLVCRDQRYPEVADMAQQLHLSERTLKRRLQAEGTSYQQLLDQVRQRDAMKLLGTPSLPIAQVAEAVGYADPANFARAFAKWTGLSPRDWRTRHLGRD